MVSKAAKSYRGSILVVEDDDWMRQAVNDVLGNADFLVINAVSAPEAINKLRNQRFDCMVLDIILKHGTGEDVIEALKLFTPERRPGIIVTSGSLDEPLVRRIGHIARDVLVKPYDMMELIRRVHAKLGLGLPNQYSRV